MILVDVWILGHFTDNKRNMALINTMYYMTQLVVVIPLLDESLAIINDYFMQNVLLKFGLCHFIVLDDDSPFKSSFITICKTIPLITIY